MEGEFVVTDMVIPSGPLRVSIAEYRAPGYQLSQSISQYPWWIEKELTAEGPEVSATCSEICYCFLSSCSSVEAVSVGLQHADRFEVTKCARGYEIKDCLQPHLNIMLMTYELIDDNWDAGQLAEWAEVVDSPFFQAHRGEAFAMTLLEELNSHFDPE
jgi:hypothetical protein